MRVQSAGSEPSRVNPLAVQAMAELGNRPRDAELEVGAHRDVTFVSEAMRTNLVLRVSDGAAAGV